MNKERSILLGVIVVVCIFVVLFLFVLVLAFVPRHRQYEEHNFIEIVAIKNLVGIEGHFFLGSGKIGSVPYYFFYRKTSRGGKKLEYVKTEYTTVFEQKELTTAYIAEAEIHEFYDPESKWLFLIPKCLRRMYKDIGYAIYVPEGTIKKGFDLDLKNL